MRGVCLTAGRQRRADFGGIGHRTRRLTGGATIIIPSSGGTANPGRRTAVTSGIHTPGSGGQRHAGVSGITIGGEALRGRRGGIRMTRTRADPRQTPLTARQCRLPSTSKRGRVTLGEPRKAGNAPSAVCMPSGPCDVYGMGFDSCACRSTPGTAGQGVGKFPLCMKATAPLQASLCTAAAADVRWSAA